MDLNFREIFILLGSRTNQSCFIVLFDEEFLCVTYTLLHKSGLYFNHKRNPESDLGFTCLPVVS